MAVRLAQGDARIRDVPWHHATEWTQADADTLEQYCDALMQSTCQMDAGQRKGNRNDAGTLVSFDDVPQILNQIACLACRQVLAGAHKPKKEDEQ